MANTTPTPVKSSFEFQDQTYKTFWNGRDYGDTKYITVNSPNGGESKVVASLSKGISVNKSHSIEFAKAAYKSITGQEW